jgi:hypothetical protein
VVTGQSGLVALKMHGALALHTLLAVMGCEHERHSDQHPEHHEQAEPAPVAALGWLMAHAPRITPGGDDSSTIALLFGNGWPRSSDRQAGVPQERVGQLRGLTDSLDASVGLVDLPVERVVKVGGWPRGAQVRRTLGVRLSALSSKKTRQALRRWAFAESAATAP